MYVCTTLDGNACLEWVEHLGLLPHLSLSDAGTIGWAIVGVWVVGWGAGVIARFLWNR